MKVIALVGSARKKHTYAAAQKFMDNLHKMGDLETEIVSLSEYDLQLCRGCKLCTDRGEEFCPLNDERDKLFEKMTGADGVIFATPNYAFNVSGRMKVFLDRFNPLLHRPQFFGKTATGIVAQGVYGGEKIIKYLTFLAGGLGFNVVKGSVITTLEPMTEKGQQKIDAIIARHSERFYRQLVRKEYPSPSLFQLMAFRWGRTSIRRMLDENYRDYTHYMEMGWFESDYYYPVKLNPVKRLAGYAFDTLASRSSAVN